jgi:predicted DNA-binding transcriptional regulator YafY
MKRVEIEYTNYKGERGRRIILPSTIFYGTTPWHTEPQWLLSALDIMKDEMRDFALKDIHIWEPIETGGRG